MRIHAMDIDQPPGIGIAPMADIEVHHMIVTAMLAAKSAIKAPTSTRWEVRTRPLTAARHKLWRSPQGLKKYIMGALPHLTGCPVPVR